MRILSSRFFTLRDTIWVGDFGTEAKYGLFCNFVPDFDGFVFLPRAEWSLKIFCRFLSHRLTKIDFLIQAPIHLNK